MSIHIVIHRNDATAVHMLVKKWLKLGDETKVRYYKQVGDSNQDTSDDEQSNFKSDDFLLVLQSPDQDIMMQENPRTLCVDATHGLTGYGYFLLSIMVIDKHGHGLPVAWAITSRENQTTWKLFAKSLRTGSQSAKPEVMMSDDDNSSWNGLIVVWPSLKHKLLCHWHIKKNVKNHCVGSKCKVQVNVSRCSC